jgi:hypothetical protein
VIYFIALIQRKMSDVSVFERALCVGGVRQARGYWSPKFDSLAGSISDHGFCLAPYSSLL